MDFVQRIFFLLDSQGKTKAQLSRFLGVKPSTVSCWHTKGIIPSTEYIPKISEFLGVSCDYLLTGNDYSVSFNNQSNVNGNNTINNSGISVTVPEEVPTAHQDGLTQEIISTLDSFSKIDKLKILQYMYELKDE